MTRSGRWPSIPRLPGGGSNPPGHGQGGHTPFTQWLSQGYLKPTSGLRGGGMLGFRPLGMQEGGTVYRDIPGQRVAETLGTPASENTAETTSSPVVSAALEELGNFAGQRVADTFGAPADAVSFMARQVGAPVPENVIGGSQSIIEVANAIRSLAENFAAQNVPDPIKQAVEQLIEYVSPNVITAALEMIGGANTLGAGAAAGAGMGVAPLAQTLPAQTLPAQTLPAQTLPAQTLPAQTPLAPPPGVGGPLMGMRGGGMMGFRPLRMDDGGSVDRETEFLGVYSQAWRIVHGEDPPERVRRWYMDPQTSSRVIEGATIELQEEAKRLQDLKFQNFLESPEGIEARQEGPIQPDPEFLDIHDLEGREFFDFVAAFPDWRDLFGTNPPEGGQQQLELHNIISQMRGNKDWTREELRSLVQFGNPGDRTGVGPIPNTSGWDAGVYSPYDESSGSPMLEVRDLPWGDEIPIPRRKPTPQGMAYGGMPRGTVAGEREPRGYLTARQAGETMGEWAKGQEDQRKYGGLHSLYNRYG